MFTAVISGIHTGSPTGSLNTPLRRRLIAALLFNVSTMDITFVTVPALLAVVSFSAMVIPAWRASTVNPIVVLREE